MKLGLVTRDLLTSYELLNVDHKVIADNTGGLLMQKGMVDMCIVGTIVSAEMEM